tara:strand:- start:234 stop:560 length:327 start_codon:yes stop_codon:yes gene_type:complete
VEEKVLDFDEMYDMTVTDSYGGNFYQIYSEIYPKLIFQQIKDEREYLINEIVNLSYQGISEITGLALEDVGIENDEDEIKKVIRHEILEELQMKYDEFINKCKEDGDI